MLYHAAHMDEEGADPVSAYTNPALRGYVEEWKDRPGDSGFVAVTADGRAVGAAWLRVIPNNPLYQFVEPGTPELAIAVTPEFLGGGVGTLLLRQLLLVAHEVHRAVVLSVRASNPARRLYERLGFVTVASITNRVGTLSYVMRADLPYP
jgi:ribosomal protein S18 acetylase RimI-like enzyme